MKLKKFFESLFTFLLENLPVLGTIGFSLFLILKSQSLQLTDSQLLVWIISLLGLIATSMLLERLIRLRKIENSMEHIYQYLLNNNSAPSFDNIFKRRRSQPSLEERLDSAREIFITGGSLVRITNEYIGYFKDKAKDKCKLKFVIVNPESEAAKLLVNNVVYEVNDYEVYLNQTKNSLRSLLVLSADYPEYVEVKVTNQVPPFGLVIADPNKEYGSMTIEVFGYALPARERGSILIKRNHEPESFSYFKSQFEKIWENSDPI